jgi:ribonuclease HI
MPWVRRSLRGNVVWARSDERGQPIASGDGRVDILYKLDAAAKVYRAHTRNLAPTGDPEHDRPVTGPGDPGQEALAAPASSSDQPPIIIYTDGACTGNPGPMGLGAVILDGKERRELSEYLGIGTNNIAELTAIERALAAIAPDHRGRPIRVHTDSSYSIGVLSQNWKPKANVELIARIKDLLRQFADVKFVKVRGHAGIPENERCDQLANMAVAARR